MKVYLIKSEISGTITYKIGKTSRNVNNRLLELSTGNAGKLTVIYEYETKNAHILENALHKTFKQYHLSGEWFNDGLDITIFKNTCENIDNNIKILKSNDNPFI